MSTRYAYWRKPNDTQDTNPDSGCAPRHMLAELGRSARIQDQETVVWNHPLFEVFEQAALGSILIQRPDDQELNPYDSRDILRRALKKVIQKTGGQTPIAPKLMIEAADNEAAAYFLKPDTQFHLVTDLSVKSLPSKRILIDGHKIMPLVSRRRYPVPDSLRFELEHGTRMKATLRPPRISILIQSRGRSNFDAVERALEALALLCGFWNLFMGPRWSRSLGGTSRRPLGVVHIGSFHTLHFPSGKPVDDLYWYEPDYPREVVAFAPPNDWEKLEQHRRRSVGQLRRSPFRPELRALIIRYAFALSRPNPDDAFLKLWSILETITNTAGSAYDKTIDRASWLFADRDIVKDVLSYVRRYRNRYVHAARSDDSNETVAWFVKALIDPHLLRLLNNDFRCSSIQEYSQVLSLPWSKRALQRTRDSATRAIKIRERWEKQESDHSGRRPD